MPTERPDAHGRVLEVRLLAYGVPAAHRQAVGRRGSVAFAVVPVMERHENDAWFDPAEPDRGLGASPPGADLDQVPLLDAETARVCIGDLDEDRRSGGVEGR